MSHTVRHKKMLLTRLKKIQGQGVALEKMLNREHECAEVLQQLAAIRGAAELLQGDMSREQQQRFVGNIDSESARLQQLIERLLNLAQVEQRQGLEERVAVDLHGLAEELLHAVRRGENPAMPRNTATIAA